MILNITNLATRRYDFLCYLIFLLQAVDLHESQSHKQVSDLERNNSFLYNFPPHKKRRILP